MSNAMRKGSRAGHRQPYAWLGAGAVTLSLGAAMVGGAAVAFADAGTDTGAGTSADTAVSTPSLGSTASDSGSKKPAARGARRAAAAVASPSASARKGRAAASALTEVAAGAPQPAAAVTPPVARGSQQGAAPAAATTSAPALAEPAAAVPNPAANPSYNMQSFLPAAPIVPGAHVKLALQQIKDAKAELQTQTWGANKPLAGIAAVAPQLFLSEAAYALNAWQNHMPAAQQRVADTVGVPVMHQLAQMNLAITVALPTLAEAGLSGAALLMPLVNMLGATTATASALIGQARSNGKVYAVIPVTMKAGTEPVVYIKVNGGKKVPVLLDTGSSGLVLTQDSVGSGNLGPSTGSGTSAYSGGLVYDYTTYDTTVDFGQGAVTGPTSVNIVDSADAQAFKDYLASAGVVGVLGVGANTAGPGPSIPTTSLPGELSDGFLLDETRLFGLRAVMILGPNQYPVRVSVPGTPDAYLKVAINDGAKQDALGIIDSGGVYGTLPKNLIGGASSVANGTKISVYTADGATLLYSYTVTSSNAPDVVDAGDLMNTGYMAFKNSPVYINYAANAAPGGIGSTDYVYT